MADLAFQFSTQGVEPKYAAVTGLPEGSHPVVLVSAEWTNTKDGTGQMLVLTATATDGPARGTSQRDNLNLQNSSPAAARIAAQQLAAYCVVCNRPQGIQQAMSEIFNVPFIMDIGPQKGAEAQAKGYMEVKGIRFIDGRTPDGKQPAALPGGPQQQSQQQPQPGPFGGGQQPQGFQPQGFQPQPGPGPQGGQPAPFAPPGGGQPAPFAPPGGAPFAPPGGQPGAPQPFQQPGGAPNGGGFAPQQPQPGGFAPPGGPAPFQPGGAAPGGAPPWEPR